MQKRFQLKNLGFLWKKILKYYCRFYNLAKENCIVIFVAFHKFQNISEKRKCWNGYIKGVTTLKF